MAKRMAEQMELFEPVTRGFEEGGLMDEGGTVDPVSGNEVPPGSTQEEVRDDIPAQLSEGEFVFPADVVRYFGLEKLMEMRQEAKMGLKRMEEMGQMGNSEEATMPDDLPFSIEDLDTEDEEEYNKTQEFARGGVVYAQQGAFMNPDPQSGVYYQPSAPITTGVAQAPVIAASAPVAPTSTYKPPQQAFTPVRPPQQVLPTYQGTIGFGPEGVEYETVTYVNEQGQTIVLKKNKQTGQLLDLAGNPTTVPEGYKLKGEEDTVAPVTTETTQVTGQGEGGDRQDYGGGTSLLTGEKIAGYSPEEIKSGVASAKDRYAITGRRGFDLLNVIPGGTFAKEIFGIKNGPALFSKDPTIPEDASIPPGIGMPISAMQARNSLQQTLGTKITGYVGFEKGDLDPNSGGFFNSRGVAVDKDGNPTKNENGTSNFSSFSDFKSHMSAAVESGWYGGELSKTEENSLKGKAAEKYAAYKEALDKQYPDAKISKTTKTEDALKDKGYPSGVTQRDFGKETASEAASREAANKAQAERQQAARDARDAAKEAARVDREERGDFSGGNDNDRGDGGGYGSDGGTGGGGDMGVICLTEDMKVKRNGVIDFVTNVKVGDIVDNTVVTEVLHKHMREGYYVVNGELKITNDHPVLANGSWKRTEDLVLGDYINKVEVTSLEYVEQVTPTVYIGTADDRYDVYTEGEVYTVHGQYKNGIKKAA